MVFKFILEPNPSCSTSNFLNHGFNRWNNIFPTLQLGTFYCWNENVVLNGSNKLQGDITYTCNGKIKSG